MSRTEVIYENLDEAIISKSFTPFIWTWTSTLTSETRSLGSSPPALRKKTSGCEAINIAWTWELWGAPPGLALWGCLAPWSVGHLQEPNHPQEPIQEILAQHRPWYLMFKMQNQATFAHSAKLQTICPSSLLSARGKHQSKSYHLKTPVLSVFRLDLKSEAILYRWQASAFWLTISPLWWLEKVREEEAE